MYICNLHRLYIYIYIYLSIYLPAKLDDFARENAGEYSSTMVRIWVIHGRTPKCHKNPIRPSFSRGLSNGFQQTNRGGNFFRNLAALDQPHPGCVPLDLWEQNTLANMIQHGLYNLPSGKLT